MWIDSCSFVWCHELSLEIWICLFDNNIYLPYASQNTHANRVVLAFVHIVSETLVGRGSHQLVWTDHPTVRSLILIAFWFSDELYLLNSCYDLFEKLLVRTLSRFNNIILIVVLSRMCILDDVIYSLSCWTHPLIIYYFQARSLLPDHYRWNLKTYYLVVVVTQFLGYSPK